MASNSVPWFVVVLTDDADGVFLLHEKISGSLVDGEAFSSCLCVSLLTSRWPVSLY